MPLMRSSVVLRVVMTSLAFLRSSNQPGLRSKEENCRRRGCTYISVSLAMQPMLLLESDHSSSLRLSLVTYTLFRSEAIVCYTR